MADEINSLKATRLLAYRAVTKRDPEYVFRHILRWYSRTFSTPLHEVEDLPIDEVMRHFFVVRFEDMDESELEEEELDLRLTDAEKKTKAEKEKTDSVADDDFYALMQAKANATSPAVKPATADGAIPTTEPLPLGLPANFQKLADTAEAAEKMIPPDIKMTFVSDKEIEDMESWDLLGAPSKGEK